MVVNRPVLEVIHSAVLQWGPTRGPGWSRGSQDPSVRPVPASVGPDPRAGMVEVILNRDTAQAMLLQWGPTRGPGWSRCGTPDGRGPLSTSVGPNPRAGMVG